MTTQSQALRKEIELHKWYLSEQNGRDVGWAAAEVNYLERHFGRFAREFRYKFCHDQCERADYCDMWKLTLF